MKISKHYMVSNKLLVVHATCIASTL